MACLKLSGNCPVERDTLNNTAINGASKLENFFTNHVGIGSELQVLSGAFIISVSTSSTVTVAKSSKCSTGLSGITCASAFSVSDLTELIFWRENYAKSSALWVVSLVPFCSLSPMRAKTVRRRFLESPLESIVLYAVHTIRLSDICWTNYLCNSCTVWTLRATFGQTVCPTVCRSVHTMQLLHR